MLDTILPVHAVVPAIHASLEESNILILEAPPGAGKSTVVPLTLMAQPWMRGQRIMLLEPRRIAARAVAARMADTLGEDVGESVGYRMRLDTCVSAKTRIEVVTEGVLTRQIQRDPELDGIGCVVFDEFHERSLQADLGLALALEVQETLRPDLKIVLMSATLNGEALRRLLPQAALVISEGRQFPVETFRIPVPPNQDWQGHLANVVCKAMASHAGNALVFLPGEAEIRRMAERLIPMLSPECVIAPLYGAMDAVAQDQAISAPPAGKRKIVLATDIAETSLTIDGISIVVDAGLSRYSSFSPRSGMNSLLTGKASRASAAQRAGRAGRLGPGVCFQIWSDSDHLSRAALGSPEICLADLSHLMLELAQWGVRDPASLKWLDAPPPAACAQATDLLVSLAALTAEGRLTSHGEAMTRIGAHPRIAHMLISAASAERSHLACHIAAWLAERAPSRDAAHVDFARRLQMSLQRDMKLARQEAGVVARVRKQAGQFGRALNGAGLGNLYEDAGGLLALAFPDRVAQRRAGSDTQFRLSGGGGAALREYGELSRCDYVVVTELDGQGRDARIFSAIEVTLNALFDTLAPLIVVREHLDWDDASESVVAERQWCLGELVLKRQSLTSANRDQIATALLNAVRRRGLSVFERDDGLRQWLLRVQLLRQIEGDESDLPDVSDAGLLASMDVWLLPWLDGIQRMAGVRKLNLASMLAGLLDWKQKQRVDELAPTHFAVPSGSQIRLTYQEDGPPILAVRLQEMFSSTTTPAIVKGKVPLLIHLLSPARRPIQITQNLVSFWANGYGEVKKELKGRYPKHHWPDDPLSTPPHHSVRPK